MDRQPLEDTEKENQPILEQRREESANGPGINEMQDMKDLSLLLGFDGMDFEGLGMESQRIYEWARMKSGEMSGPKVTAEVKKLVRGLGLNSKGKELLRKLSTWVSLDSKIQDSKERMKLISEKG